MLAEFYHISSTIAYLATLTFSQNQKSRKLTEFLSLFSKKNHRSSTKKSHETKLENSIDVFCLPAIKPRDRFLNIILKEMLETQKKSQNLDRRTLNQYFACHEIALHISPELTRKALGSKHDLLLLSQIEDLRVELQRKEQELMQMQAKMKTVEEQHADYQKHIAVLKESLIAKEEHYNMLQLDVSQFILPRTRFILRTRA